MGIQSLVRILGISVAAIAASSINSCFVGAKANLVKLEICGSKLLVKTGARLQVAGRNLSADEAPIIPSASSARCCAC